MEKNIIPPLIDNFPQDFKCPISMELMKEPVTIVTGVTYDRKNIEKWFNTYRKKTCPATMQPVETLETTPNHTLKRLMDAWLENRAMQNRHEPAQPPSAELATILENIDSTPFKVTCLKKLRSIVTENDGTMRGFKRAGGVEILVNIITQILAENYYFATLRACEEALGVLHQVPFSEDDADDEMILDRLMRPDCMRSMAVILQRGSSEARHCAISIFQKMSKADYQWNYVAQDQGVDFFKSLLDTVSDEICSKTSSCALQLLIQILEASKKSRLKAIEAGAICSLVELLPESNRSRSERILQLIKIMCECADGRLAFIEHGLGIAAVSKKMVNVSNGATRAGVKIMWLISSFHPTERVLEEMLLSGAVRRMVAALHSGGGNMKDRVVKILRMHGGTWRRYPCFPAEVKNYLGWGNDSC